MVITDSLPTNGACQMITFAPRTVTYSIPLNPTTFHSMMILIPLCVVVVGREFVHPLPVCLAIVVGRSQVGPRESLRNGVYTCRAVDVAESVFDQNPDTAAAHDFAAHRNAADDADGSVSLAAQDPHNVIGGHDFPDVQ